jgi:membrane-associated phospholipid phosphatase
VKKRWIAFLVIVFGAILAYIAYYQWDIPVAYYCRGLSREMIDIAEMITIAGESRWYFILFVPAFIVFRFMLKNKYWSMKMLFFLISISASGLVNMLVKWIAGRNRPINIFNQGLFGFNYFEVIYESTSFPSGHTVTAFSLAVAFSILFPRSSIFVFVAATAIALSRVMLTSHYISDVIAGAVIGIVCTLIVKYYFDRFNIDLTAQSQAS